MTDWLVNGQPGGNIAPDDRGFAYGDGLFETIAVRNGVPRFLARHLARLTAGCAQLQIPLPESAALREQMQTLIGAHQLGTLKIILTRGRGPRGYAPPAHVAPTCALVFSADEQPRPRWYSAGMDVVICRTPASSNAALAGLKTLNRLDNVLARAELRDAAAGEGLMCDDGGRVIGGTMSNIFAVRQGGLLTPQLDRCGIRGIMRSVVLEVASAAGIAVTETAIPRAQLMEADEIFMTNALVGIQPVRHLDGRPVASAGMTRTIAALLHAQGVEECGT